MRLLGPQMKALMELVPSEHSTEVCSLSFAASDGYCHLLTYNFFAQISHHSALQSPDTSLCSLSTLLLVPQKYVPLKITDLIIFTKSFPCQVTYSKAIRHHRGILFPFYKGKNESQRQ